MSFIMVVRSRDSQHPTEVHIIGLISTSALPAVTLCHHAPRASCTRASAGELRAVDSTVPRTTRTTGSDGQSRDPTENRSAALCQRLSEEEQREAPENEEDSKFREETASSLTTAMLGRRRRTDCTTSTFTASDSPNDPKVGFKLSEFGKRGAYTIGGGDLCVDRKSRQLLTQLNKGSRP
ncbi:hypothetical protein F2P81_010428 [Scophthalmus maximus]|uniref:Uncharacterized protein n=1 Tax=Scophthalmus maximus TaxID=52904 RepID=A0A6A4T2V9_SCOMX|nr:hypothetical protein F2P81_010428 [Scophthalmus maximus]